MTTADELWTSLTDDEKRMLRKSAEKNTGEPTDDEQMLLKLREASPYELDQFEAMMQMVRAVPAMKMAVVAFGEGKELDLTTIPPSAFKMLQSQVATEPSPSVPTLGATGAEAAPPVAPVKSQSELMGEAGAKALMQDPAVRKLMDAVGEMVGDSKTGQGPMQELKKASVIANTLSLAQMASLVRDIACTVDEMELKLSAIYNSVDLQPLMNDQLDDAVVRRWVAKRTDEIRKEHYGDAR